MSDANHYDAIRNSAAVYSRFQNAVKVTGYDRDDLLGQVLARSIEFFQPGTAMECLALDDDGGVIDQILALIDDDDVVLMSERSDGLLPQLQELADKLGVTDVAIDPLPGWASIAVEGPQSWKAVSELASEGIASLALNEWCPTEIDGVLQAGRLVRIGTTGEYGYLVVGEADADALKGHLLTQAQAVGGCEVDRPAVLRASLEVSHPMFPETFVNGITVAEAGLLWAAGAGRDDEFRGKDAAFGAVDRSRGVVAVEVAGGDVPAAGTPVLAGDKEVGTIHIQTTRAGTENGFGLALLEVPFCVPGLGLAADGTTLQTISRPHAELRSWREEIG